MRIQLLVVAAILMLIDFPAAAQSQENKRRQDDKPSAEQKKQQARQRAIQRDVAKMMKLFDKDRDGLLDADELPVDLQRRFASLDTDEDGRFSEQELRKMRQAVEVITGPSRKERHEDKLETGDPAPDFTLPDPRGRRQVTLSNFRGKKPVVLIFGSYT